MYRITIKDIENGLARLNRLTNNPLTPYSRSEDGKFTTNIGNYHLSQAYGGCQIHQMLSDAGGITCPITAGHVTKRECFDTLHAFINGVEAATWARDEVDRAAMA